MDDYELDLPKDSFINISTLALNRKVLTKSMSLQDRVRSMLGKILPKRDHSRVSDWTKIPLDQDQVQYAAMDAYASILVYSAIVQGQDPMFDDFRPTPIIPGKRVNIYDSTGSTAIAKGVVQEQTNGSYRDYRQMVTPSRAVFLVTEVLVPCALIPIVLSKVELQLLNIC